MLSKDDDFEDAGCRLVPGRSELEAVLLNVLPLPRSTTGVSRSLRKSSSSEPSLLLMLLFRAAGRGGRAALLRPLSVLGDRNPALVLDMLPLRPRGKPNRPYPSCPVPAAGPLLGWRFGFSAVLLDSTLGLREKKPNRGGLTVLEADTAGESFL